jgi:hypothetical protein
MKLIYLTRIFVTLTLLLSACSNSDIDTSKVPLQLKFHRFDKALQAIDTNNVMAGLIKLQAEHPHFTNRWTEHLLGSGMIASDTSVMLATGVRHFLTYKDYVQLQKTINQKFPNTNSVDKDIASLCKHVKYYVPKFKCNTVYYFSSGLNRYSTITDDTIIGIGLDMFLGKDYEFYPAVQIPKYMIDKCEPEQIIPMLARTIFTNEFTYNEMNKDLLTVMINRGREIYFGSKVAPNIAERSFYNYNAEQEDWCKKYEGRLFGEISKFLYETDPQKVMPIVTDGPSTPGMPLQCPGNVGTWIGYQIVKKYMDKNPKLTLEQLCTMDVDGSKFLEASGYKPR